jgi:DNA-binding IclR family transcriptional regulator
VTPTQPVSRPTAIDGGLRSVASALDVLDCFTTDDELGVTEIARRVDVAKSTAHRLLTTLASRGLVERVDEGRYRLGTHAIALGQLALERNRIRTQALPALHQLQRMTGATIHLAVWEGAEVMYLERLTTAASSHALSPVGRRLPSHCTSSGKVMAAFTPTLELARATAGFPPMTSQSINTAGRYAAALQEVRRQGYATNVGEAVDGFSSVAAPVLDHSRTARAAISIVAPTSALMRDLGTPVQLVQRVARRLTKELCL